MGIPGLWKCIKEAAQSRTLTQLTVNEGFEINRRGTGTVFIGIDGSLLLNRAQWAAYHQKGRGINMQAGENLPLQILLWQVCRLLSLPITPVFIFDGPKQPKIKRGRQVKSTPHALMSAYMQLLKAAGFYAYIAPGEAEAELAQLNAHNIIDAIITDDADTFLFGATCIIRTSNVNDDGDHVSIYTSSAIENHENIKLTPPRMLLIALLSGGDYSRGLTKCGIKIAHEISLGTSLGEDLFTAVHDLSPKHLSDFLDGWRKTLRHVLRDNPHGILRHRQPALAEQVTNTFPDPVILRHYLLPVTSFSDESIPPPDISSKNIQQPDLAALAVWSEKYFSWGSRGLILDRFRSKIWGGICIRSLMMPFDVNVAIATHILSGTSGGPALLFRPTILQVYRATLGPGTAMKNPDTWGYSVQVEPHSLITATLSCLASEVSEISTLQSRKTFIVWIPAPILKHAFPELIKRFHSSKPEFTQQFKLPILHGDTETNGGLLGSEMNPIVVDD